MFINNIVLAFLVVLSIFYRGFAQAVTNPAYADEINALIDYSVPLIDCNYLAQNRSWKSLVVLDSRTLDEYAVSHLRNARHIGYEQFRLHSLRDIPKNTPIVVYCSIGYRSEKIGEKLLEAGFKNVYNLYGGIFEWSNQLRPLFNEHGRCHEIHPYDQSWGKWLNKGTKTLNCPTAQP